jgi:hypothetical protein
MRVAKTGIDFAEFGFDAFVSVESLFTRFPAFILEQFRVSETTKSTLRRRVASEQDGVASTSPESRAETLELVDDDPHSLNDALNAFTLISTVEHFVSRLDLLLLLL